MSSSSGALRWCLPQLEAEAKYEARRDGSMYLLHASYNIEKPVSFHKFYAVTPNHKRLAHMDYSVVAKTLNLTNCKIKERAQLRVDETVITFLRENIKQI